MKEIELEEGAWVLFIYDGKRKLGQIRKKDNDKPLSIDNFWIRTTEGFVQPLQEQILKVYPCIKLITPITNPSKR